MNYFRYKQFNNDVITIAIDSQYTPILYEI